MFVIRHLGLGRIVRTLKYCSSKGIIALMVLFCFVIVIPCYLTYHEQNVNADSPTDQTETLETLDKDYLLFLIKRTFTNVVNPDIPNYKFNETLSHSIPLDRDTPDHRNKDCHNHPWVIAPDKRVSIIIPFINEVWSTLLRTVFSILIKSPLQYIQEIILVDDQSTRDYLIEPLREVLRPFKQISLVRTPRNLGAAGARNYAARFAKGNTLIFLDAHCEMNIGWLEPLLDAVTKNPTKVIIPNLGVIDNKNLNFLDVNKDVQNTLTWTLAGSYGPFQQSILNKYSVTDPIPSASQLGAAFVMDKSYYWKLGGFGKYFVGWGSEDIEMGIKSWLCGGGISKCRCSLVGHLFKDHPYKMTNNPWMSVAMMADTWLDEFIPVSKCIRIGIHALPDIVDKSPMESTFVLKKKLKCKPFRWFINNVFPELGIPEANTRCIGASVSGGKRIALERDNITMIFCDIFSPTVSTGPVSIVGDKVKLHGKCMTYTRNNTFIFDTCRRADKFQSWQYRRFQIRSQFDTSLCLARQNYKPILHKCRMNKLRIEFQTHFKPGCIQNNE